MKPLVSVITTVYNAEKFIKESVESILSQDFNGFELCILIDGCTDNTHDIIESSLNSSNIDYSVVVEKDNRGIPICRNQLIEKSKGEFVAIHDADDISLPHRLRVECEYLEKYPDVFCVGGWAMVIDEDGKNLRVADYPPSNTMGVLDLIKKCRNPIIDPSTMFRKKDFLELGGYSLDRTIWTVPDFDLWLRALSAKKKIHNIQAPLIKYRLSDGGITRSKGQLMKQHHMRVWRPFMEKFFR
jgi:glycosyltransferase EpsE